MTIKKSIGLIFSLALMSLIIASCQITPTQTPTAMPTTEIDETETEIIETTEDVDVVIELDAFNYAYSLETITVKQGQTVRIELTVTQGFHDWVVDEFLAATDQASAGNTVTVDFLADEIGEFEYYCSIGNHRALGMVGTLIVE